MKIVKEAPFDRYHFDDIHLSFVDKLLIKNQKVQPTFNRSMFNQDFARIFHYTTRRNEDIFNIESNNEELTQRLLGNVKTKYKSKDLDNIVRELVEEIARSLIWAGNANYFLYKSPEEDRISIVPFSGLGVFSFLNIYFQLVPKRCEKHWDRDNEEKSRELRILDRAKLMRFSMPKSIRRILTEQNRVLKVLDKHQYKSKYFFPEATHENPNPVNDFSFSIWRDIQERVMYRGTRGTGWDGRKYDSSKRSDFFFYHRLIRFRRNQLILRNHILVELGKEFTRVGHQYDKEYYIIISPTDALPKIDRLDDLEDRLSREEVSFNEILEYCYDR